MRAFCGSFSILKGKTAKRVKESNSCSSVERFEELHQTQRIIFQPLASQQRERSVCVCLESVLERCVGLLILWPCLSPCLLLLTTCFGYLAADSHPYLVLGFQFLSILSVDFLTIPRRCFLSPILTLSLISLLHTSLLLVPHHLFICLFFVFFVQLPFFPCLLCLCSNNTKCPLLCSFWISHAQFVF